MATAPSKFIQKAGINGNKVGGKKAGGPATKGGSSKFMPTNTQTKKAMSPGGMKGRC